MNDLSHTVPFSDTEGSRRLYQTHLRIFIVGIPNWKERKEAIRHEEDLLEVVITASIPLPSSKYNLFDGHKPRDPMREPGQLHSYLKEIVHMGLNPEWRKKREMEEIKQSPTAKVAVETFIQPLWKTVRRGLINLNQEFKVRILRTFHNLSCNIRDATGHPAIPLWLQTG